jgi:hypothetical protein
MAIITVLNQQRQGMKTGISYKRGKKNPPAMTMHLSTPTTNASALYLTDQLTWTKVLAK